MFKQQNIRLFGIFIILIILLGGILYISEELRPKDKKYICLEPVIIIGYNYTKDIYCKLSNITEGIK